MFTSLARSVFVLVVIAPVFAAISTAAGGPDTMEGRWVVANCKLNDEDRDPVVMIQYKKGAIWKLHADGTGEIVSHNYKWDYNKEKRTLTLQAEGLVWGWNTLVENADVTKDGKNVIIKFVSVGVKYEVTLKPDEN